VKISKFALASPWSFSRSSFQNYIIFILSYILYFSYRTKMPSYSSLKTGLLANSRSIYRCRDGSRIYAKNLVLLLGGIFISSSMMMLSCGWAPPAPHATTLGETPALPLHVCLMTADFWGANAAGGTATAFELLARELQKAGVPTTLVGVSASCNPRAKFNAAHKDLYSSVFLCEDYLDIPLEKETHPYETTGLLALKWLRSSASGNSSFTSPSPSSEIYDNNLNEIINSPTCSIVHWHEWGGMAVPSLVASDTGFLPRSQRHIVQLHGGNLWSSQHAYRPRDLTSLRIDANEKLSVELAHEVTSPSQYMAD
jgi:hypothetical protein